MTIFSIEETGKKSCGSPDEFVFDGLLTKAEFFALTKAINRDGAIDEEEMNRLTRWASQILAQAELVKLVMEGWMIINGWKDGEPLLRPTMEDIEFLGSIDFSQPMLEESKC